MAEVAGYNTTVYVSGESAAFTTETMTGSGAGPYQIAAAKRIWDPEGTFSFFDNGVAISSGDILSIDYLLGTVTFTASKTGPITATGDYLPRLAWLKCRGVTLDSAADSLDTSVFGSQYKSSIQGMRELSGSAEVIEPLTTDLDSGADSRTWDAVFAGGTQVVLEISGGGVGGIRFWAILLGTTTSISTADLVGYEFAFASVVVTADDGTRITPAAV